MFFCKCGCGQPVNEADSFVSISHRNKYKMSQASTPTVEKEISYATDTSYPTHTKKGELVGKKFIVAVRDSELGLRELETVMVTGQNANGTVDVRSILRPNIKVADVPLSFLTLMTKEFRNMVNVKSAESAGFEGPTKTPKYDDNIAPPAGSIRKTATTKKTPVRVGGQVAMTSGSGVAKPRTKFVKYANDRYALPDRVTVITGGESSNNPVGVNEYGMPIGDMASDERRALGEVALSPEEQEVIAAFSPIHSTTSGRSYGFQGVKRASADYDNLEGYNMPVRGTSAYTGNDDARIAAYESVQRELEKDADNSYIPDQIFSGSVMELPDGVMPDEEEVSDFALSLQEAKMQRIQSYQQELFSKDGSCPVCGNTNPEYFKTRPVPKRADIIEVWCHACAHPFKTAAATSKNKWGFPVGDSKIDFTAEDGRARRAQKPDSMDGARRPTGFTGNVRDYDDPYGRGADDSDYLGGIDLEDMSQGDYFGAKEQKLSENETKKRYYKQNDGKLTGKTEAPKAKSKWTDLLGDEENRWGGR